jgi:hypothetical protein
MKYILGIISISLILLLFRDQLSDLWQSIAGTPHVCDAGGTPPLAEAKGVKIYSIYDILEEVTAESHGSCD